MLPDDVLLEMFDFYVDEAMEEDEELESWQTLVHVCRRWRSIVFGSPRRLNLQLVCTTRTSAKDTLDVWPELPLVIEDDDCEKEGLIALLERSELVRRITEIELWEVHLEDISEAMEVPFPELRYLWLHDDETELGPLSDSFLGGSAPRLQSLHFECIPFPGLPKLLSSATHLTNLHLLDIPHSGYISPEVIVACFSLLTNLDGLSLEFRSPQSRPDRESRRPSHPKRSVLPVLSRFWFKGVSEYLEALVALIDAPQLNFLDITFFNDVVFDTPQFTRLISDTPTFIAFDEANVAFGENRARIKLTSDYGELRMKISCRELDWQLSFLEQVCTSSLPPVSVLEELYICEHSYSPPVWEDNIDNTPWLELLYPFSAVKNLFLSDKLAPRVVSALQELVGGRTREVLPTLQNVYLGELHSSGPVQEGIGKFIAARQLTSDPVVVSHWESLDRDSW